MRFSYAAIFLFLTCSAVTAHGAVIRIANDTRYEIIGLSVEGLTEQGLKSSSYSAFRALPGQELRLDNGVIRTVTMIEADYGLGRVTVDDCSLGSPVLLSLSMDENSMPGLISPDGTILPAEVSDLRFDEQEKPAIGLIDLLKAADIDAVRRLGGDMVQDFRYDSVMPVRLGEDIWTGIVSADTGNSIEHVRLLTETWSAAWAGLPNFFNEFKLYPIAAAMPDGDVIPFYSEGAKGGVEEDGPEGLGEKVYRMLGLIEDDAIWEEYPEGKLAVLLGPQSALKECSEAKESYSPVLGTVLRMSSSDMIILDIEKDISGRLDLVCGK